MSDGSAVDGLLEEVQQLREENAKLKRFVGLFTDGAVDAAVDTLLGFNHGVNQLLSLLLTAKHTMSEAEKAEAATDVAYTKLLMTDQQFRDTLIELKADE